MQSLRVIVISIALTTLPLPWMSSSQASSAVTRTPALFVQGGLAAPVGSLVDVPIAFDSAGQHVAALSFSLNYEEACLSLDPSDADGNGLPDAITLDAPAQFLASITIHPTNQAGRVNVVLADYIPPLAALRDSAALITFQFRIVCPVAPGLTHYTIISFAEIPAVGFSDGTGHDLPGVARDGAVQIIGAIPATVTTATPTPSPLIQSPTPTAVASAPSTPVPTPVVKLETTIWPEQLAPTDRSLFLVLDYVILSHGNTVVLTIPVPQHTYFDELSSSIGWHCGSEVVNPQCQFALYDSTHPNNLNGRIFFAVGLNWPLPTTVTQIDFSVTLEADGAVNIQKQEWVVPLRNNEATPTSGSIHFRLSTLTSQWIPSHDSELRYTLTYTNNTQSELFALAVHLILPSAVTLHPPPEEPLDWSCQLESEAQQTCSFMLVTLAPAETGQVHFLINQASPSSLENLSALVLVAYATQQDHILDCATAVVLIQHSAPVDPGNPRLFFPLIIGGVK